MQASNLTAGPSKSRSPRSIAAQIAALQAELQAAESETTFHENAGQQDPQARVLVQHSPSPKKKAKVDYRPASKPSFNSSAGLSRAISSAGVPAAPVDLITQAKVEKPSALLQSLNSRRSKLKEAEERRGLERSVGFSAPAIAPPCVRKEEAPEEEAHDEGDRDESLALIEKLEMGPKDFTAPKDDPDWEKVEPNSRIRLKQRLISHEDVQEHLSQRYHITPSLLYSIVRPGRSGSELEVPLDGDFIIIGVLAEKSDIRMQANPAIKAPPKNPKKSKKGKGKQVDREDADELQDSEADEEEEEEPAVVEKKQPKRFVIFKLLDMRLKRGQTTASGDGALTVFLFESTSSSTLHDVEQEEVATTSRGVRIRGEAQEQKKTTVYKGGSGGAYEKFCKESNGTVVAILNPRVLKPKQGGKPHPTSNTLSITPESADSFLILGRSEDLGTCEALKRDGNPCGSWCDKRINTFCDFHIQNAVQKKRSGRSELMIGTSSLTQSVGGKGKKPGMTNGNRFGTSSEYDPSRKTGLLPNSNRISVQGVTTYVTGGNKSASRSRTANNYTYNNGFAVPSEAKEKEDARNRKRQRDVEEKVLLNVLKKDGGKTLGAKYLKNAGTLKGDGAIKDLEDAEREENESKKSSANRPFNAASLRAIGFDPTRNDTSISHGDEDAQSKKRRLEIVSALDVGTGKGDPKLGPAPSAKKARLDDDEDEDDLVVLREGENQPKERAKVVWQMHARKFAPKNGPSASPAALLAGGTEQVASTYPKPIESKAKAAPTTKGKKKQNTSKFKTGTEDQGGVDLSQLMKNFKNAGR